MIELAFSLPWPPSQNHYWRSIVVRKRAMVLISEDARKYRRRVQEIALALGHSHADLAGSLDVEIIARPPDRRARDLDNLLKPSLDSLKHAGIIRDDVFIDRLQIMRGTRIPGGQIDLIVRQLVGAVEQQELEAG